MKLLKLSNDHFIIVDDLEIKQGDWVINKKGRRKPIQIENPKDDICEGDQKITHSTQPLASLKELFEKGYDTILPLNLAEVKELIGEVDIEKKADEMGFYDSSEGNKGNMTTKAFISGYNQALEDNKDKKYTEEDIRKAIAHGFDLPAILMVCHQKRLDSFGFESFVQSLQPKTEWEVQFVNYELKLK